MSMHSILVDKKLKCHKMDISLKNANTAVIIALIFSFVAELSYPTGLMNKQHSFFNNYLLIVYFAVVIIGFFTMNLSLDSFLLERNSDKYMSFDSSNELPPKLTKEIYYKKFNRLSGILFVIALQMIFFVTYIQLIL